MSPIPAAPSTASMSAWAITSPSEWPASPRSDSTSTPPRTSGTPSTRACASTPRPTLIRAAPAEPRALRAPSRSRSLPRARARARHRSRGRRSAARPRPRRARRAGACRNRRSPGEPVLHEGKVVRVGHLHELRVPFDHPDAAALSLHEGRTVRGLGDLARDRPAQDVREEGLRGLDGHEVAARQRLDHALTVDALDRVGKRHRRDDAVPALRQRREHSLDHFLRQQRARRVVHEHHGRVLGDIGQRQANGLGARGAAGDGGAHLGRRDLLGHEDRGLLPVGRCRDHDRVDPVRGVEPLEALGEQRPAAEARERLRPVGAEPLAATCRSEDGPDHLQPPFKTDDGSTGHFRRSCELGPHDLTTASQAMPHGYAVAGTLAVVFFLPPRARTPSSHSAASSSSISLAYISSLARIFFAFTNICFSPVERPFSWSRRERFRTTSANSRMSPVFILSRLCLKRRFQFFGIWVPPPVKALTTTFTMSSPITLRRPTASAFSDGTLTVMSLCRILIVRYSRFSPSTSRFSFFTTVPAP